MINVFIINIKDIAILLLLNMFLGYALNIVHYINIV